VGLVQSSFSVALLVFGMSCAENKGPASDAITDQVCDDVEATQVAVIQEMWFARPDGTHSAGVDLDGMSSTSGSASGCGVMDYSDPETGEGGIDNAFGGFLPILEQTEGAALEVYIQDLINSGEILLMIEMEDADDPDEDECVNVNLMRTAGAPTLGTDGLIASHQTFQLDPEQPTSRVEGAAISESRLVATPMEFSLPFQIFDIYHTFNMQASTLHFDQGRQGHHSGVLTGGIDIQEIISLVDGRTDIDIGPLIIGFVESQADLWPDEHGQCQGISIVFEFNATPAFIYEAK
jgi:hypothetical protein